MNLNNQEVVLDILNIAIDIAAGHIILEEAGVKLKSFDNTDIFYNTKESIINPNFLAYGKVSKLN